MPGVKLVTCKPYYSHHKTIHSQNTWSGWGRRRAYIVRKRRKIRYVTKLMRKRNPPYVLHFSSNRLVTTGCLSRSSRLYFTYNTTGGKCFPINSYHCHGYNNLNGIQYLVTTHTQSKEFHGKHVNLSKICGLMESTELPEHTSMWTGHVNKTV